MKSVLGWSSSVSGIIPFKKCDCWGERMILSTRYPVIRGPTQISKFPCNSLPIFLMFSQPLEKKSVLATRVSIKSAIVVVLVEYFDYS